MTDYTTELTTTAGDAQAIIDAVRAGHGAELLTTVPGHRAVLIVPQGATTLPVDLEAHGLTPVRHSGTARLRDPRSFLAYVAQVASGEGDETTAYYGDPDRLQVVAVFNDHGVLPGWRDHQAELTYETTPEWDAWTAADKKFGPAATFAEFLEDWRHTILDPSYAALVDMVRSFKATQKVSFKDEIVDASGDRALEWVKETTAGATKGLLEVPDQFTLQLAPFLGAEATELVARFRYRLDEGRCSFGVSLEQPGKVLRDAFEHEIVELISALDAPVMLGRPAA